MERRPRRTRGRLPGDGERTEGSVSDLIIIGYPDEATGEKAYAEAFVLVREIR